MPSLLCEIFPKFRTVYFRSGIKSFRKPFEKMWVDAKSVQETPAGVLIVRRGLFFVKRQRRYAAYLQKWLDTRIVGGIILTAHSSQLTAHSVNAI